MIHQWVLRNKERSRRPLGPRPRTDECRTPILDRRRGLVVAMVCAECGAVYEQRLVCSKCNIQLTYESPSEEDKAARPGWRQSPWGRMMVGLALAQGVYYGLKHLGSA